MIKETEDAINSKAVATVAIAAKEIKQSNQLIESLCNEIYKIAHKNKIPIVLMHQDNIYIQDDARGTNRLMMENLDKTLSN